MHISPFPLLPPVGELHASASSVSKKKQPIHGVFKRTRGAQITHLPAGYYERILKISDFNLDSENVASLQRPIWAVVPSDWGGADGGAEKYVTSEFADVAQPPCGKPPKCTRANQHFTSVFLRFLFCVFLFFVCFF